MLTKPIEYSIPITPDTAVKMALNLSTKTIYYVDDNGIIQIVGSVASNNGVFNNVTITGGTIQGVALTLDSLDNTPIGSNTPSTGRFTTLTTTGLASFNSMSTANATITGGTISGVALTLDSLNSTPVGNITPSTGAFTTLSASGVFTSTVATGTSPFSIASTTVVPNLNVSQLLGNTWAVPGAIGSTTPNSGAFTILSANSVTSVTPVLSFNASNTIAAFGSTTANSYNQLIIQNKSGTSGASTNYVISNDIGTDSTYYGEFGMNSSVFSASTPSDFFSINNGVYFSGHDGDLTYGSGNGFKSYFAWGATGNSAHVINTAGAIGLSTNLGTTPALSGTTGFGTAGQVMISNGSGAANSWSSTPTLVGTNFTGIPNGALTNSSITFGSTAVALGATVSGFNGVNIGATTAGTGAFTTLSASSTVSGAGFSTYLASPPAIGSTVANTGAFTTLSASSTVSGAGFSTYLTAPPAIGGTTPNTGGFTTLNSTGGALNGTIGATTPNTGAFTTLSASSTVSGAGFSTYLASPPAIGGTTPAAGTFTTLTVNTTLSAPNTFGFKNRIINGAMMIDQRNAGASVTQTGALAYCLDRFYLYGSVTSKFTVQQNAASVTPPAGFINYLGATSSAATSVGSGDTYFIGQRIEGFNASDLAWGTASAATVTLSFWVRSSLTGTFGGALRNSAQNRSYPFSYTISASNTWEQKTITIAGDTSGTWLTTNGVGIDIDFSMGTGSTLSGTAGSWAGTNYVSATGATSVVGTNGATFYITGVQLEKGAAATSFDLRPYTTELALCQRYCINNLSQLPTYENGAANTQVIGQLPVTMRATPSISLVGTFTYTNYGVGTFTSTSAPSVSTFANNTFININQPCTVTGTGRGVMTNGYYLLSAEF